MYEQWTIGSPIGIWVGLGRARCCWFLMDCRTLQKNNDEMGTRLMNAFSYWVDTRSLKRSSLNMHTVADMDIIIDEYITIILLQILPD